MKQIIVASIVGLAAASVLAQDAQDAVKSAAKALAGKDYSWVQTTKNEGGGGGGGGGRGRGFGTNPIEGKINKEGLTYVTSKFTMQGEERTMEAAAKGDKFAYKGQDGWQAPDPSAGGGGRGRGGMFRNMVRGPAVLAQDLVGRVKELKAGDEGVFSGDFTEEGAKALLTFGGRGGGNGPEVSGAKGSVKFWIKEGVLAKVQYNVQGKVTFNDQEREVNRTTTIEVKNVGSTMVNLPDEAKEALK